ncbi:chromosomal replication initiator protein DnaA [Rhodospirillum rubrum]|uniref:Chromosomal replication initiator protein DnaA n=1 Tax=Rhodospirillum rubrum (strain ATCC 11170 / ATH 1.1.1 / DSM 467 / LMG 4362 / NCIMB 8255 / S1) TaxID=269796 RepID=Q2RYI9_RHORT|nr:chromosomal replication initiator protein DnaA [Rhodospirillum rubrum]ABC20806.1 chromosomal replication initiator protein, DnaA [Rhodospirillum rubrum ATCC 11170]AEO46472.1 chromosomal replication initiation protein [Rhodospirillum rubrum F11]MBK5956329.1 chromosomal replication initiation protein DnaA [Rhodospirillum rubrum]QXG80511.1 chromosomal replication initiator protein DnaA [Rhodospirillum rubrum]HAP99009.1 chromosomal replication initiator protein DnaA [Rhodospirillum rubrum]
MYESSGVAVNPQNGSLAGADGCDLSASWDRVRGFLKREFGDSAYRTWVVPMTLVAAVEGEVRLAVPTRFMRDWVMNHYGDRIRSLWAAEDSSIRYVDFIVESAPAPAPPARAGQDADRAEGASDPAAGQRPAEAGAPRPAARASRTMVRVAAEGGAEGADSAPAPLDDGISAPLDPRFTFDNFVVGKPNEFAYAAAKRVADSTGVAFNPLFLYGGVGLGKTHLMHAIARGIREASPHRRVIYLSAEQFMHRFIRALRQQDTMSFKEQFRSVEVLMVDDIQFISGKDSTQEEFFHTFNALVDQGSQIVLSADKSPTDLENIGARLRSRMACGLVADLHPTTYELRLGILESKAEHMGVSVPEKVLEFIAHKIASNGREVEGALIRLIAHAQLVGRDLTLETAQDVLHDLLRTYDKRVTVDEIQKKVAEHFKIRLADMHSARRARAVARPRQVAMYLCKQLTSRSLPEIGKSFGGRDHTTVMHAVRKVEELILADGTFAEDVELLRRMLEA